MSLSHDALYYPYIHVRQGEVDWLKATLLCFPHVHRMVPAGFELNDHPSVREFAAKKGYGDKPLLDRYDLQRPFIHGVQLGFQQRLEKDLDADGPALRNKFSRDAARAQTGGNDSAFQIHRHKFVEELLTTLESTGLAWPPSEPNRGAEWLSVHPVLGEALLSTVAAAIAEEEGLGIVTSSGTIHRGLATRDVHAVYDAVIHGKYVTGQPDIRDVSDELAQVVILTNFRLESLTVDAIASLTRDGESLFEMKKALEGFARQASRIANEESREKQLRQQAEAVIDKWQEDQRVMSNFARKFFTGEGMIDNAEELLKNMATGVVVGGGAAGGVAVATGAGALTTGALTTLLVGAVPGLAIGVVFHGAKTFAGQLTRRARSPFRYLSRIEQAGAALLIKPPVTKILNL
jgi:hypothetical protein